MSWPPRSCCCARSRLPETTAGVQELRQRLEDNLTNLALGDLNADGDTNPVIQGSIVRQKSAVSVASAHGAAPAA